MKDINFGWQKGLVFWQADIGKDRYILDFLRGFAAILVYLSHADQDKIINNSLLVAMKGPLGCHLFFVISGYLIWRSVSRNFGKKPQMEIGKYVINRATRILPLYWINILFCLTLLPLLKSTYAPSAGIVEIARHLTFTQSFDPSVARAINPVLWTLGHEGVFYVIAPLLYITVRKHTAILLLASWLLSAYASSHSIPVVQQFLMIFNLFASGIFMAEKKVILAPWISVLLMLVGLLLLNYAPSQYFFNSVSLISVGFFTLPHTLLNFLPRIRNFLDKSNFLGITWVGMISYSLYIWHYLLINIFSGYQLPQLWRSYQNNDLLCAVLFTSVVMIISYMSYLLIEKPSMTTLKEQLLNRISKQNAMRSP
ncbi:acyltransferase [Nostoc edaphicum CCNP1411]|uniref:Acyltransferase n=1 Tax=Nostoc edaphicum CCNP1411 TaxID=1472755 RepID=A0A7D7QVH2_9NOSO|nr:acyltransferase [Nostoc edaphicum]QMS90663.1 acyltransferase [Nostoc edaphicum CCNP1411]